MGCGLLTTQPQIKPLGWAVDLDGLSALIYVNVKCQFE